MGVICWAAILEAISEVGKRCLSSEDPEIRGSIDSAISRMDAHLKGVGGWNDQQLDSFKRQMGERDKQTEEICANGDALDFYRAATASTRDIEQTTSAMLTLPGKPEWGTCL